jgi:hypothetical protein
MDYDDIKQLALELGRPAATLYVLAAKNDPFYVTPARRRDAEWFGKVWRRLRMGQAHYRRIHYRLISLRKPPLMTDGRPYRNSTRCWNALNRACRDAVYLGLVPIDAYVDQRNAEPLIHQQRPPTAARCDVYDSDPSGNSWDTDNVVKMPDLPRLLFGRPHIPQPYQVEIWVEKTTVNDVLEPLAREFDLNVQTGVGELSGIYCRAMIERLHEHRRPTRVLYVSDFDPAGRGMPVSVAVKAQHELFRRGLLDANVQVRPVVLTYEQCVEYRLPRTPAKDARRAAHFAARFGEGVTELDALEAIHPGLLRRILVAEINRYRDPDLAKEALTLEVEAHRECRIITEVVHIEHRPGIAPGGLRFIPLASRGPGRCRGRAAPRGGSPAGGTRAPAASNSAKTRFFVWNCAQGPLA